MELTKEVKQMIDNMTYSELLQRWRFAPVGDTVFQGETGEYYCQVMAQKRKEVGNEVHVATSKNIGW